VGWLDLNLCSSEGAHHFKIIWVNLSGGLPIFPATKFAHQPQRAADLVFTEAPD
jgi:hypothetical protein